MGCSHCLSDCKPIGQHMDSDTFEDVIGFCEKNINGFMPLITGGEPGEHPQFGTMMAILIERLSNHRLKFMTIMTNGSWIESDASQAKVLLDYAKSKNVLLTMQITNDKRYYPRTVKIPVDITAYPNVTVYDCPSLTPQGRALNLSSDKAAFTAGAPLCYNARLIARQGYVKGMSFKEYIRTLRSAMKMCVPSIEIDGSIKAGESMLCPAVGTIYDNPEDILRNIAKLECRNCKMAFELCQDKHPDAYDIFELLGQAIKNM